MLLVLFILNYYYIFVHFYIDLTSYSCDVCNLYFILDPVSLGFDGILNLAGDNLHFVLPALAAMILLLAVLSTCCYKLGHRLGSSSILTQESLESRRFNRELLDLTFTSLHTFVDSILCLQGARDVRYFLSFPSFHILQSF